MEEAPKIGGAGALPPWNGGSADPIKTSSLPICVTRWNLVVLRQRG